MMRAKPGETLRRGAAATEMAILPPMLCYICLIVADYSRLFYALVTLSDSARAGALYYATRPSPSAASIKQAALADAGNLTPKPTVTTASGTDTTGNAYGQVTISYQFTTLMPHPGIPSSVLLSRKVVMMPNPP